MYRHCAADHCSDKTSEVQVGFAIIKRIEWRLASIQRLLKAFLLTVSMTQDFKASPRLTSLSHGGGCGCKIAPGVLSEILRSTTAMPLPPELLVGIETSDDAAVYKLNDSQALVATTDFFMPIVDDPFEFGRIAATNAISDVYAMGAQPIMALALVGMPVNVLPLSVIGKILDGGQSVCRAAGIPIAGGHTIDSVEPIYGLVDVCKVIGQ